MNATRWKPVINKARVVREALIKSVILLFKIRGVRVVRRFP